jgi:L,D-transpeptidase YcbB
LKKFKIYLAITLLVCTINSCKKKNILSKKELEKNSIPKLEYVNISNDEIYKTIALLKNDSLLKYNIKHKDSIIHFYQQRKGKAAWQSIKNRAILSKEIANSITHGLNPKTYNDSILKKVLNTKSTSNIDNALIDILFTDNYLSYTYHLANGKVKPHSIYNDWRLKPNTFNYNSILSNSIDKDSLVKSFNLFAPQNKIYEQLKKQLVTTKKDLKKDSTITFINKGTKIKPFKSNDRVINIRKRLNELGFLKDSLVNKSNVLDSLLQLSIKKFQASTKLKTDAIIGDETINALNKTNLEKYNSILCNLERWRWFPRTLGNDYITVNIANYQLKHFTKTDTTLYNVIVGKTARKTPVFSSKINYLDFNPKWFIPPTIKKEDIIPAATKDVNYLRKKNISVFNKGKKMNIDSINWNSKEALKYSYIQSSGSSNALGRVKIIFPNDFSVYLHDTPGKSLFNKVYRARSSGCVRVQNVFKLASEILKTTEKEITRLVESNNTKRIHIKTPIYVHFLYWNITFNTKGNPVFLNDVYNLDIALSKKLTN